MAEEYGLSFHIDMRLVKDVKTHFIKSALVSQPVDRPLLNSFRYEIPGSIPHGPRRLGASETLGIFGGVEDSAQKDLSEVVERNIGDALTLSVMQFLARHRQSITDGTLRRLLVLGPPMPKMLGRFASLRMPRSLGVGWFYCFPPPEWLSSFPGWSIVSRAGHHLSRLWMEDELVVEDYRIVDGVEYRVAWMNQYVGYENVYSDNWMESVVDNLTPTPWVDTSVKLPRVLALAALYSLAERVRIGDGRRESPLEVLAAASLLDGEVDDGAETHFTNRLEQLQKLVSDKPNRKRFQGSMRGGEHEHLAIADLPDLIELWNEIRSAGKVPQVS